MDAATVKVLLQTHMQECEFDVQGEGSNYDITAVGLCSRDCARLKSSSWCTLP